jgi:hypothetical protein
MSDYMNSGVNDMVMVDGENRNAASVCRTLQAEIAAYKSQLDIAASDTRNVEADRDKIRAERDKLNKQYSDLLYQVINKHPNETRHETAMRIIYQHEHQDNGATKQSTWDHEDGNQT